MIGMAKVKKYLLIAAPLLLILAVLLAWLPFRMTVTASSEYVGITINRTQPKPEDTYQQPANRQFFISEWTGAGTRASPFRPSALAGLKEVNLGAIDLRPN